MLEIYIYIYIGKYSDIVRDAILLDLKLKNNTAKTYEIFELLSKIKENENDIKKLLNRIPNRKGFFKKSNVKLLDDFIKTLEVSVSQRRSKKFKSDLIKNFSIFMLPLFFAISSPSNADDFDTLSSDRSAAFDRMESSLSKFQQKVASEEPTLNQVKTGVDIIGSGSIEQNSRASFEFMDLIDSIEDDKNFPEVLSFLLGGRMLYQFNWKEGEYNGSNNDVKYNLKFDGSNVEIIYSNGEKFVFDYSQYEKVDFRNISIDSIKNIF